MAIDTYVSPTSWNDLGMDWTDPDPFNAVYYDAIARAAYERYLTHMFNVYYPEYFRFIISSSKLRKSGYNGNTYASLLQLDNYIKNLFTLNHFIHPEKMVNIELIQAGDSQIYANNIGLDYASIYNFLSLYKACEILGYTKLVSPQPYSNNNSEWLKQCYNLLNLLKYSSGYPIRNFQINALATGKRRDVFISNNPDYENIDKITDMPPQPVAIAGGNSAFNQDLYYYYYSAGMVVWYQSYAFYFPEPIKYRINSYIKLWESSQNTDFKSNEVSNAGWYHINTALTDFKTGISTFTDLQLGDLSILPYPSESGKTNSGYQRIYDFIYEFDFSFKS